MDPLNRDMRRSRTSFKLAPGPRPSSGLSRRHGELGFRAPPPPPPPQPPRALQAGGALTARARLQQRVPLSSPPSVASGEDEWVWSTPHSDALDREPSYEIAAAPRAHVPPPAPSALRGSCSSGAQTARSFRERALANPAAVAAEREAFHAQLAERRAMAPAREVSLLPATPLEEQWWDEDADPLVALLMRQLETLGAHGAKAAFALPPPGVGSPAGAPSAAARAAPTRKAPSRSAVFHARHRTPRPDVWHSWIRGGTRVQGARAPAPCLSLLEVNVEVCVLLLLKVQHDLSPPPVQPPVPAMPLERISLAELSGEHYARSLSLSHSAQRYLRDKLLPALDNYADVAPSASANADDEGGAARTASGEQQQEQQRAALAGCGSELGVRVSTFRALLLQSSLGRCDLYLLALTFALEPLPAHEALAALARGRVWLTLEHALLVVARLVGASSVAEHLSLREECRAGLRSQTESCALAAAELLRAARTTRGGDGGGGARASGLGVPLSASFRGKTALAAWDGETWLSLHALVARSEGDAIVCLDEFLARILEARDQDAEDKRAQATSMRSLATRTS